MTKRALIRAAMGMILVLGLATSGLASTWSVTGDPSVQTGPGSTWSQDVTLSASSTPYDMVFNVLLQGTWDGSLDTNYTTATTLDKLIVSVLQGSAVIATQTFDTMDISIKQAEAGGLNFSLHALVPITTTGVYTIKVLSGATMPTETWGLASASGAPAATPVPAAVWMLGTGLLGLMGYKRARRNAA